LLSRQVVAGGRDVTAKHILQRSFGDKQWFYLSFFASAGALSIMKFLVSFGLFSTFSAEILAALLNCLQDSMQE
jgi:hypothetical protein